MAESQKTQWALWHFNFSISFTPAPTALKTNSLTIMVAVETNSLVALGQGKFGGLPKPCPQRTVNIEQW